MADSLQPWIGRYLIDIAETHGANLTVMPYFLKKKKVQLVEFITYDLNTQNDCIWGKVSDKEYKIPVRFTKEAMSQYNRPGSSSRRLTEHKTALISITDFQPFFARIPLANKKGMTKMPCMALNIRSFTIIGSTGEAEWGRPRDIETNADLLEWSQGLRKDGGEGNILKDRKTEREKDIGGGASSIKAPRKVISNGSPQMAKKQAFIGPKAPSSKKVDGAALAAKNVAQPNLLKEYERSWRPISLNTRSYALKPQSNECRAVPRRHALDLNSSQPGTPQKEHSPSQKHGPRLDPSTPSEWSMSARGSQAAQNWSEDEVTSDHELYEPLTALSFKIEEQPDSAPKDNSALPNTFTAELSSHPSPPTPAQRPKPYVPPTTSSPPQILSVSFPTQTAGTEFLPALSHSTPNYTRRKVMRKVPHPAQPPPKSSMSGPAHILVPSSDTSGTASQPHSQSQPATQSILSSETPILPLTREVPEEQHSSGGNSFHSLFGVSPADEGTKSPPNQSITVQDVTNSRPKPSSPRGDDRGPTSTSTSADPGYLPQKISASDDSDTEDESNDQDQSDGGDDVDESQEGDLQVEHSPSIIVPDSQEGQLDEDDAQIDEMLFGPEESTDDEHSVKEGPWPTNRTENLATNETIDLLRSPAHDTSYTPPQVSQRLPRSRSKDALQSPIFTMPAPTTAIEQSIDSCDISQRISILSGVHHVERDGPTPSLMHDKKRKGKEAVLSLEISERKGSPVEKNESVSRTSTKKLSNGFLSLIDIGTVVVTSSSTTGAHPIPEIHGESSGTSPAVRVESLVTADSGRDSSGSTETGRKSHKRSRATSPNDGIDLKMGSSKRRKLADVAPSRASGSRQKLDQDEGGLKFGEVATLRPTQKGGNAHRVVKDEPFSQSVGGRKLKGFQANFDNIPCDDQRGWAFSWGDLQKIMLQTGRKRQMEQKQKAT